MHSPADRGAHGPRDHLVERFAREVDGPLLDVLSSSVFVRSRDFGPGLRDPSLVEDLGEAALRVVQQLVGFGASPLMCVADDGVALALRVGPERKRLLLRLDDLPPGAMEGSFGLGPDLAGVRSGGGEDLGGLGTRPADDGSRLRLESRPHLVVASHHHEIYSRTAWSRVATRK